MKQKYILIIGVLVAVLICSKTYSGLESDRNNNISIEQNKKINYKPKPKRNKYIYQARPVINKQII